MKTIIVDDEVIMLRKFQRISSGIRNIELVGSFEDGDSAIQYMKDNRVDLAFLDIDLPVMNGIELSKKLREIRPDILIVFLTAHDEYIQDSNEVGGDYYLIKPYTEKTLGLAMDRLRLIGKRQNKSLYIQMFGRFLVLRNNNPIKLSGKAKEILAVVAVNRGKEVSNERIYSIIWEDRPYGNREMAVYYNALRRLRRSLATAGLQDLLISTRRGQMINTDMFDCDYYTWQDGMEDERAIFTGEFLFEYSWGEAYLAEIVGNDGD